MVTSDPSQPLLIRADANIQIGTGHLMRCLALAQAWQDASGRVVFLMATESPPLDARLRTEGDVLDRYQGARKYQADLIVRITSDCPLIEPEIVDQVVQEFLERQLEIDYASNIWPRRTFPQGLDTEIMRIDVLERAWYEDRDPFWREHVTPYIYRNPDRFRIHNVLSQVDYSAMRWTVDTPEDLTFVRQIYDYFGHDHFCWREVLKVLEEHPDWLEINRYVQQKAV